MGKAPVGHRQPLSVAVPAGAVEPDGHGRQEAPSGDARVLTGQSGQTTDPVLIAAVPGGHAEQEVAQGTDKNVPAGQGMLALPPGRV